MSASTPPASRQVVLVLHGLACNPWFTRLLSRRLREAGFDARDWGYPTWFRSIEWSAQRLALHLSDLEQDPHVDAVHLVGHSMGGIVARCALARRPAHEVRRLVMLGSPNGGAWVVSWIPAWTRPVLPTLYEVSKRPQSLVNTLPPLDGVEVGVVAARRDHIVELDRTHLPEQRDHVVVPGRHLMLLFRRDAASQTVHFLQHGRFAHHAAEAADHPEPARSG